MDLMLGKEGLLFWPLLLTFTARIHDSRSSPPAHLTPQSTSAITSHQAYTCRRARGDSHPGNKHQHPGRAHTQNIL